MPNDTLELVKGSLDVLILKTLSWGPAHGYAVSRWIRDTTHGALHVEEGALYPALHRLERKGWIESEWGLSENNRRAKFYRLTSEGRERFRMEVNGWERFLAAIGRVLSATEPPAWATQT